MSPASLLVLESLLPEARKVAERQNQTNERQRETAKTDLEATKQDLASATQALRSAARRNMMMPAALAELRASLDGYFDLVASIKSSGRSDQDWQAIKKSASRMERVASQLSELVDTLAEQRAITAGWFSMEVFGFVMLAVFLLPIFFGLSLIHI